MADVYAAFQGVLAVEALAGLQLHKVGADAVQPDALRPEEELVKGEVVEDIGVASGDELGPAALHDRTDQARQRTTIAATPCMRWIPVVEVGAADAGLVTSSGQSMR